MAEELRYFFRTAIWIAIALIGYWVLSQEPAGTVLLGFLLVGLSAFVVVAAIMVPASLAGFRDTGPGRFVTRLIGFHERTETLPPLHGEPELVPLASVWPIVTAAAFAIIGMGLIFGPWLLLPGLVLLVFAGVGWLTQLDRP